MLEPAVLDDPSELKNSDEGFHYDRDELVALIKRYYRLLLDMGHLPRNQTSLQWPPEPAGWSDDELNVTALRLLGRSEKVIDFLRHIPYPLGNEPTTYHRGDRATVDYHAWVKSFLRKQWSPEKVADPLWYAREFPTVAEHLRLPFLGPVDPDIISLTYHEALGAGHMWIIDTERGCMYPFGDDHTLYDSQRPPEARDDGGKQWLGSKAVSFTDFFHKLYDEVWSLQKVPAPAIGGHEHDLLCGDDDPDHNDGGPAIKELYYKYGWPDAFRRDEFLEAATPVRAAAMKAYLWGTRSKASQGEA